MKRIYAIALNTLREAVRDRILYAVSVLATLVLLGCRALAELSLDQEARVIRDLGTTTVSLFSVLVSLFLGSSLLYKEIERKTLYMVIPKPIHRFEFLLGKFLGIVVTGWAFIAMSGAVLLVLIGTEAGGSGLTAFVGALVSFALLTFGVWYASRNGRFRDPTAIVVPWAVVVLIGAALFTISAGEPLSAHLRALLLIGMEVIVLTSVALFFSSFSTPFLTSALSVGVWLVGRNADTLQTIRSRLLPDEIRALLRGLAEVMPNFNLFVPGTTTIGPAAEAPWSYVGSSCVYGVLYGGILVFFASLFFRRRDLA